MAHTPLDLAFDAPIESFFYQKAYDLNILKILIFSVVNACKAFIYWLFHIFTLPFHLLEYFYTVCLFSFAQSKKEKKIIKKLKLWYIPLSKSIYRSFRGKYHILTTSGVANSKSYWNAKLI